MPSVQQQRAFSGSFNSVFARLLERVPDYVSLGLVILCGFLLARLVWMFVPSTAVAPPTAVTTSPSTDSSAAPPPEENALATAHLFGQYKPNAPVNAPAAPIQSSQLAIKLQGVYARSGHHGYAFIEEGGKQKAYALGETIGNSGATLEKIFPDHVLIRRNNTLEKLILPKLGQGNATAGAGGANFAPMPEMPDMGSTEEVMEPEMPDMPPQPELQDPTVSNVGAIPPPLAPQGAPAPAQPEANGNAAANNGARLMEVVSPQPYERDGKFVGFQLTPGSNVAMFTQYGLQSGDIVTAINGTQLDSPATAMQLMQGAATTSQVNLTITRNGQEINLPINLQ